MNKLHSPYIGKRTFSANKYPKGHVNRRLLNETPEHSEYYTSEKWYVRSLFLMSDGTPHPQVYIYSTFRTRKQAKEYVSERLNRKESQ